MKEGWLLFRSGVGCKNALGMQRLHVRKGERALCENTEAECQSCE